MIGEIFGNYRVIELIGEGGMGVVYLAEHPGIGRRAAIKILRVLGNFWGKLWELLQFRAFSRPLGRE